MASEQLTDLFNASIGSVTLARPGSAEFTDDPQYVDSFSNGFATPEYRDLSYWILTASIEAQDPQAVPLVAAMTPPYVVEAAGRVVNTDTYRRHRLLHACPTAISLSLEEGRPATASFRFRARAASGSSVIADEHTVTSASAPSPTQRAGAYRLISAQFTSDGGGTVGIPGLSRVTWSAEAQVDADADNGELFENILDYRGWNITGEVAIRGQAVTANANVSQVLAESARGTLTVTAAPTGRWDSPTPPANLVFTFARVKFGQVTSRMQERARGEAPAQFHCLRKAANGSAMTLAQMISVF